MAFDRESWDELLAMRLQASTYTWQAPRVPAEVPVGHVAGDVRVLRAMTSAHLDHPRDVWVYLPPGYHGSADLYPVLYMHDGNNLFDPGAAFCGRDWGLAATAERLIRAGKLPPTIIVGAGNSPARMAEYTWEPCARWGGGHGVRYARFLVDELKPFIDRRYRTRRGREHTAVLGSSLGGLISLYLGLHHGDTFGNVGAMSPSLWWAGRRALRDLAPMRADLRIWVDMGGAEGPSEEASWRYLQDARELRELLQSRGFRLGRNLAHWEDPGASHTESAWGARAAIAMPFLVGGKADELPQAA